MSCPVCVSSKQQSMKWSLIHGTEAYKYLQMTSTSSFHLVPSKLLSSWTDRYVIDIRKVITDLFVIK